jgi:Mg-chelatase subunit ChlD
VSADAEQARRWRLVLGGGEADGIRVSLGGDDARIDAALQALYDSPRGAGLGASAPSAVRWLGDIRTYFPSSTVQVVQNDAFRRLGLQQMLLEPEMLESVVPDVRLVATLLSLRGVIPAKTRDTARRVVRTVVDDIEKRLRNPLRAAVTGSLNRAARTSRPRPGAIDWARTIRANLKHYQRDYHTIVPERPIGFARRSTSLRDVILCVDQSGSMATSVVYAGILGAVLASIKAVRTSIVLFDTAVVDLTDELDDPVDVLFGTQLGGGTDINRALAYCQTLVRMPSETVFVLVSDLFEGGNRDEMFARAASLARSGVTLVALLALDDLGSPRFDAAVAARFAELGIPAFACTPDLFPELMAAAIERRDLAAWAALNDIVVAT